MLKRGFRHFFQRRIGNDLSIAGMNCEEILLLMFLNGFDPENQ